MATLVFGALGTLAGGPVGGALGALLGQQVDNAIFAPDARDGPPLKDLSFTTSSYGAPIPRIFGRMRVPGTIIWATEIRENSETIGGGGGGGKGKPAMATFSYSASFAVAVSSRPIRSVERIWADGNLLRGKAGDLKTGGALRIHRGMQDQRPDPLIASAIGPQCPAFRDCAYVVFEDLQLGEFGSRIPALTFEVVADEANITAANLLEGFPRAIDDRRPLRGLAGFSDEGESYAGLLRTLDPMYPVATDCASGQLVLRAGETGSGAVGMLPGPAMPRSEDGSAAPHRGFVVRRAAVSDPGPAALRYYDPARDYQPGVQRAEGRGGSGQPYIAQLPASLSADTARALITAAASRARQSRTRISWRLAELDPAIGPGRIVTLPDIAGQWRIDSWEWLADGIELELTFYREPDATDVSAPPPDDDRAFVPPPDLPAERTVLDAFELPPAEIPTLATRLVHVAASAAGPGWSGAALYAVAGPSLQYAGRTGTRRARSGYLLTDLPPSPAIVLERQARVEVELSADDLVLDTVTAQQVLASANRIVVGAEVLQYMAAQKLAPRRWRLTGLLRGRLGSEPAAMQGSPAGTPFTVLDERVAILTAAEIHSEIREIAAIGLGDDDPVTAEIRNPGAWAMPPCPVHGRVITSGGTVHLRWTRRGRGAWAWPGDVEVPLVEASEAYRVGIGPTNSPHVHWDIAAPHLSVTASEWTDLARSYANQAIWVRQIGSLAQSPAVTLTILRQDST